jgi:hypothetical protein
VRLPAPHWQTARCRRRAPRPPAWPAGQRTESAGIGGGKRRFKRVYFDATRDAAQFAADAGDVAFIAREAGLEFGHAVQVLLVVARLGPLFFGLAVVVFLDSSAWRASAFFSSDSRIARIVVAGALLGLVHARPGAHWPRAPGAGVRAHRWLGALDDGDVAAFHSLQPRPFWASARHCWCTRCRSGRWATGQKLPLASIASNGMKRERYFMLSPRISEMQGRSASMRQSGLTKYTLSPQRKRTAKPSFSTPQL